MSRGIEVLSEAQRLEREGKLELAIEKYKQTLELGEGDQGSLYQDIGKLLFRLNRLDESVLACQEALRLNPDLQVAHRILGYICYRRGEYVQAEKALLDALRLWPNDVIALIYLANMYSILHRYQEASMTYEKAVKLQPQDPQVRIALANVYREQAQPARAIAELRTAFVLKPTASILYLYAAAIVETGLMGVKLSSFWARLGAGAGLMAIALLGPGYASIPIGVLVSVLIALVLLAGFRVRRGRQQYLIPSLSLVSYCACYWLFVWLHSSRYSLGR